MDDNSKQSRYKIERIILFLNPFDNKEKYTKTNKS